MGLVGYFFSAAQLSLAAHPMIIIRATIVKILANLKHLCFFMTWPPFIIFLESLKKFAQVIRGANQFPFGLSRSSAPLHQQIAILHLL
jgi:hypothetical protein